MLCDLVGRFGATQFYVHAIVLAKVIARTYVVIIAEMSLTLAYARIYSIISHLLGPIATWHTQLSWHFYFPHLLFVHLFVPNRVNCNVQVEKWEFIQQFVHDEWMKKKKNNLGKQNQNKLALIVDFPLWILTEVEGRIKQIPIEHEIILIWLENEYELKREK